MPWLNTPAETPLLIFTGVEKEPPLLVLLEKTIALTKGIGALKVLTKITDKFMTPNGDIVIPRKDWIKFCKPYLRKSPPQSLLDRTLEKYDMPQ